MRWFRRPEVRRKERNRIVSMRAVRVHKREPLPGFYLYGDIEANKRKAAALRKQAQRRDG